MENQSRLRVGIVGCGYQGGIMAKSIKDGNEWQVTACADPDQDAAARVAAIAGDAAVYASVEEMLQHPEVDAVIVATSHDALYECSLAAIRAGKHVLTEKPMGMDEKEATQLEEAVERANICFMAGYSFRYISAWQKVRELLDAGAVGEIHGIVGSISLGPMSEGWIANPEMGGGPLLYVGSHLIDQILWYLSDDPLEVSAYIRYRADTKADETTTFQLRFAKGAVMQGMVSQAGIRFIHNLDIFGHQGFIGLRGGGFNYTVEVVSKALSAYSQPMTIHFPQVPDLRILMHLPQLAEFARAIREHRQPSCTVTDGRRVLKIIDAIVKSDRSCQQVRIR
ncbi:MAG TPA: Gfo/Idh/MocA family oxidoreductase [Anaerolineales bacterium]|nr:Gfo/Idh/MocA family oxidoreductase [Anaerolineales bacterium]